MGCAPSQPSKPLYVSQQSIKVIDTNISDNILQDNDSNENKRLNSISLPTTDNNSNMPDTKSLTSHSTEKKSLVSCIDDEQNCIVKGLNLIDANYMYKL